MIHNYTMNDIRLYRKNQLGIGIWRIWPVIHNGSSATLHYAHATVMGGAEVCHNDSVILNQSGRNISEQVDLEMKSRINRQLDKGYKFSVEEAQAGITNQLGLINPMLAQPLDKISGSIDFKFACVQRKYDGHRTLITNVGGELIPYTRKGKLIHTIPHVLKEVGKFLPEGVTLDGELYIHKTPLQTISSIIKRVQPDNAKLKFHWYDLYDANQPDLTYYQRYMMMYRLVSGKNFFGDIGQTFSIVPTHNVSSLEQSMEYFRQFRAEEYEGAILRLNNKPYQNSVRSSSLIKLKEWHDCEVTVRGVRPSKDGWAILDCELDNGKRFDTSAPGTIVEKTEVLNNAASYIGRRLTIEYASLTNDGLPFHASALRWRDDLE